MQTFYGVEKRLTTAAKPLDSWVQGKLVQGLLQEDAINE